MKEIRNQEEYYVCIARKISSLRRKKGISQIEFAKNIGLSSSYFAKIESAQNIGGLSFELLYLIAAGLSLNLEDLHSFTEEDITKAHAFLNRRRRRQNASLS